MSMGEGGEALTVIDKEEAWVFHVMPDDTGANGPHTSMLCLFDTNTRRI
jgi:hypothetical protein